MNIPDKQLDLLKELINIGVGMGANTLNELLSTHVTLEVPQINVLTLEELEKEMNGEEGGRLSTVSLNFEEGVDGVAILAFPRESANKLVSIVMEKESSTPDMDSLKVGALTEIGNIIINGVVGTFANILEAHLKYDIPSYREGLIKEILLGKNKSAEHVVVMALTDFNIEKLSLNGNIIMLFEMDSFDKVFSSDTLGA